MDVVIFVGLQGAGKSTFYRQRFASTHALVSKDLLHNNRHPERRQLQLVEELLIAGRSVVVDNTNPTLASRAPLLALARAYAARAIGYYFDVTLGECLRRNAQREGKARVPDVALFATRKRLMPPAFDEGFDRLYRVRAGEMGGFVICQEAR